MEFQRAVPPGPAAAPEQIFTGLALGDRAPEERPHVVCNFVETIDGKGTAQGRTALLGGDGDRAAFRLLRTQVDAVVAGTGTLRVERYGVLVRDEKMQAIRVAEGRAQQPLAVVISRSGDIPFDIPLFGDARATVAVYTAPQATIPETEATIIRHDLAGGQDELAEVLHSLRADHGVRALLCEGGPALFAAMLGVDLVDELFLTLAPVVVGGRELGITTGDALSRLLTMRLVWVLEREGNLFLRYARPADRGQVG